MKWILVVLTISIFNCGYRTIQWQNTEYKNVFIQDIQTKPVFQRHVALFQNALNDRCLAMSGLTITLEEDADLILETKLHEVGETIIATDIDRRIRQVQFTVISSFRLVDKEGKVLWNLSNYRFSDQFEVSTTSGEYSNDAASSYDSAFKNIAELVVTHFSISISHLEEESD